ncbi:MAG: carbamoylphosphate synthase large subunit, partial [Oscillospiraceae bacterium]|nr:carbamoylphosphate synthase large subunit [Oscillospiraceae bacterium]
MNFVFVSPNFPKTYWMFCDRLKKNGANVLGIGDCPYDDLQWELKNCLTEYYKVSSLANYDEMYRAVAYFAF